jgi:isochorismate hydrolase
MREDYIKSKLEQKGKEWQLELEKHFFKRNIGSLNNAALLVIDMQNFFFDEKSHAFVPSARAIIPNIKKLITVFKKNGLPVIFTRQGLDKNSEKDAGGMMTLWWKDILYAKTDEAEIVKEMEIDSEDIIINKKNYGCFKDTSLNTILKEKDVDTVVITGVMTHLCCDTTAREAFMNDYKVLFVADGTATYTEDLHLSSLKILAHGFAIPVLTGELVDNLKR